jgi:hypothetical protein
VNERTPINPYQAPRSPIASNPEPRGLLVAVFVGFAVGNGLSYAALSVMSVAYLWLLVSQGVPYADLYVRAYQSPWYVAIAHAVAFCTVVPGGYWCARLCPNARTSSALYAGVLLTLVTLVALAVPYGTPAPLWSQAASIATPIPAYLLGSAWWRRAA